VQNAASALEEAPQLEAQIQARIEASEESLAFFFDTLTNSFAPVVEAKFQELNQLTESAEIKLSSIATIPDYEDKIIAVLNKRLDELEAIVVE
jgi:radical SAM superfamily enzyme